MTMPQLVESTGVVLPPATRARLASELEKALDFHEERLLQIPEPDDISMAVHRRSEEARDEVLAALSRIVDNTYGTCERCHGPISEERLEAIPQARHCMTCARNRSRVA